MAIGPLHVEWLSALRAKAVIPDGAAVLDLGPQDVQVSREYLAAVALRHLAEASAREVIDRMFDGATPRPDCQPAFYQLFGAATYASLDAVDPRATYRMDLNDPVRALGPFEVVTNFGSLEHVFDIGQAFRWLHRVVRPGGISLHAMPCFAFVDHGFYNVHPCFFYEFARANAYEVADIHYVDNFYARNKVPSLRGAEALPLPTFRSRSPPRWRRGT